MTLVLNGTTGVSAVDGSAATPAIQGNDSNTGMFFPAADTIAFAEGGAEVARFDSSGNLGLGVTPNTWSVGRALELGFAGNALWGNSSDEVIVSQNAYYNSGWKYASTRKATHYSQYDAQHRWFTAPSGTAGNAITWTQAMTLDSSGNLLVGGTSITPAQSNVSGFSYRAGIQLEIGAVNSQAAILGRSNDGQIIRFYNGGSIAGNISNSGTTTSYNGTSDYRLKEDVQPMTGALAKVASLKPCTFTWKNNGRAGQGFIAHELQQVIPDAVQGAKDAVDDNGNPDYQGIDPRMIVATLTAALQEQQALIAALQADVAALKGQA